MPEAETGSAFTAGCEEHLGADIVDAMTADPRLLDAMIRYLIRQKALEASATDGTEGEATSTDAPASLDELAAFDLLHDTETTLETGSCALYVIANQCGTTYKAFFTPEGEVLYTEINGTDGAIVLFDGLGRWEGERNECGQYPDKMLMARGVRVKPEGDESTTINLSSKKRSDGLRQIIVTVEGGKAFIEDMSGRRIGEAHGNKSAGIKEALQIIEYPGETGFTYDVKAQFSISGDGTPEPMNLRVPKENEETSAVGPEEGPTAEGATVAAGSPAAPADMTDAGATPDVSPADNGTWRDSLSITDAMTSQDSQKRANEQQFDEAEAYRAGLSCATVAQATLPQSLYRTLAKTGPIMTLLLALIFSMWKRRGNGLAKKRRAGATAEPQDSNAVVANKVLEQTDDAKTEEEPCKSKRKRSTRRKPLKRKRKRSTRRKPRKHKRKRSTRRKPHRGQTSEVPNARRLLALLNERGGNVANALRVVVKGAVDLATKEQKVAGRVASQAGWGGNAGFIPHGRSDGAF